MLIHASSDSDLNKDIAGSWGREPALQPAVDSGPGFFKGLITLRAWIPDWDPSNVN